MPFTRHSAPIDHFRIYLSDHKDKRFNEYMTVPASWTATEAHAGLDSAMPCDQRPYRTAWQYEGEIDQLKRQLDTIAKERNNAQDQLAKQTTDPLAESFDTWARELASLLGIEPRRWTCDAITAAVCQVKAEAEKAHKDADAWKNLVDFERAKYAELSNSVCRGELLAKKHAQLDPQYGATAEREKRQQLEMELLAEKESVRSWRKHLTDEQQRWKPVSDFIQKNATGGYGRPYADIAVELLTNQKATIARLEEEKAALRPADAVQQDNETLKKQVDDWRAKVAKTMVYERSLFALFDCVHVGCRVRPTPEAIEGETNRALNKVREWRSLCADLRIMLWSDQSKEYPISSIIGRVKHLITIEGVWGKARSERVVTVKPDPSRPLTGKAAESMVTDDPTAPYDHTDTQAAYKNLISVFGNIGAHAVAHYLNRRFAMEKTKRPTPEDDRKVGEAMTYLSTRLSQETAIGITCLLTAVIDARHGH